MNEAPAGLYLHVPFCARVCPYCDFAVRTGDRARRRRFVDRLLAEIELYAGYPLQFDTIYFGGGTPSTLEAEDLSRIVETARRRLSFADSVWGFLEVNPEDVTRESAEAWRRLGVQTLSLGIQSLDEQALTFLGRRHGLAGALRAVELAQQTGFRTVSIDLIYGLPGQGLDDWRRQLDRALALGVQHISCYQLTVHAGTRFGLLEKRGQLSQLPQDDQADLFGLTHRHLGAAGMPGYEVSQFAVSPAHHSRHNLKYWDHTPYLGLGPSAHSFHDDRRWWNIRRTDPWQESVDAGRRPVEEGETIDRSAILLEALMLGLRTYAGVDLDRLAERWGVDLRPANGDLIGRLEQRGLLALRKGWLVPTLDGLAVADSLAPMFTLESSGA